MAYHCVRACQRPAGSCTAGFLAAAVVSVNPSYGMHTNVQATDAKSTPVAVKVFEAEALKVVEAEAKVVEAEAKVVDTAERVKKLAEILLQVEYHVQLQEVLVNSAAKLNEKKRERGAHMAMVAKTCNEQRARAIGWTPDMFRKSMENEINAKILQTQYMNNWDTLLENDSHAIGEMLLELKVNQIYKKSVEELHSLHTTLAPLLYLDCHQEATTTEHMHTNDCRLVLRASQLNAQGHSNALVKYLQKFYPLH